MKIPAGGATHEEMVTKLVAKVLQQHGMCAQQIAGDPKSPNVAHLEVIAALKQDVRLAVKKRHAEAQEEVTSAKLRKAEPAIQAQSELKRQESRRAAIQAQSELKRRNAKRAVTAFECCHSCT